MIVIALITVITILQTSRLPVAVGIVMQMGI